jgi:hypothetical protein
MIRQSLRNMSIKTKVSQRQKKKAGTSLEGTNLLKHIYLLLYSAL